MTKRTKTRKFPTDLVDLQIAGIMHVETYLTRTLNTISITNRRAVEDEIALFRAMIVWLESVRE